MATERKSGHPLSTVASLGAVLLVWWGVTASGLIAPLFLPGPGEVALAGWSIWRGMVSSAPPWRSMPGRAWRGSGWPCCSR